MHHVARLPGDMHDDQEVGYVSHANWVELLDTVELFTTDQGLDNACDLYFMQG